MAAFLASSSAVAKPFTIFCLTTGGGVGGKEAGGVGGLLRLFCCAEGGGGEENSKETFTKLSVYFYSTIIPLIVAADLIDELGVVVRHPVQ